MHLLQASTESSPNRSRSKSPEVSIQAPKQSTPSTQIHALLPPQTTQIGTHPANMPAKKRAAAAAAADDTNPPPPTDDEPSPSSATAATTEQEQEQEQEAAPAAGKKAKKAAKQEVVLVTERDPLPAKPALPPGRGFKVRGVIRGC